MTKGGRIAGGILILIGGSLMLIMAVFMLYWRYLISEWGITGIIELALAVLTIIGGFLLLTDKTVGVVLALTGGAFCLFGLLIPFGLVTLTDTLLINGIDPMLVIFGGILSLGNF